MRARQYAIYKGMGGKFGALQLNPQKPHYYRQHPDDPRKKEKDWDGRRALLDGGKLADGWKEREGCVFFEAASATGRNIYDWKNKVNFAMSVHDIGAFLHGLTYGDEVKLMHDPGAGGSGRGQVTKKLYFKSPNGIRAGGMLYLSKTERGETTTHAVPLSGGEVIELRTILADYLPKMLAW